MAEKKSVKTEKVQEKKAAKPAKKKNILEKIKGSDKMQTAPQKARQLSDPFDVIKFVLMTEKSIRMVESQNKLVFIVNRPSKKKEIKSAIEQVFGSPVSGVTTLVDQAGRKKAFVKFRDSGAAGDIAIKLGVI